MPRLKPDTKTARRAHILDAAEICFARSGFHRCTMHDICREAGISPGALYVYFRSKEDLIAGIAERDRSAFQERFAPLAGADDILSALRLVGEQYFVEEPVHKRRMCVEIGIEATRNATVGEIFHAVDEDVQASFRDLFARLAGEGRIAPVVDVATLARLLSVIGDGMMWRRAIDPEFDPAGLMPALTAMVGTLINPQPSAETVATGKSQARVPASSGGAGPVDAAHRAETGEAVLDKPRAAKGKTKAAKNAGRSAEKSAGRSVDRKRTTRTTRAVRTHAREAAQ